MSGLDAAFHKVAANIDAGEGDPCRACTLVITGLIRAEHDGSTAEALMVGRVLEAELEALAASLEGAVLHELLLRGTGEDGDIRVIVHDVAIHGSLRDYRSWLQGGTPRPTLRRELTLRLELDGEEGAIQAATSRIAQVLRGRASITNMTLAWRASAASMSKAEMPLAWRVGT